MAVIQRLNNSSTTSGDSLLTDEELKQGKANRTSVFFKELKNRLIRPYRISKYCIGTMDLYSNKKIKPNRFKKKYLYINKLNKAC